MSTPFKNVIFRRNRMSFFAGQHTGVYSLNYRPTCRLEARQVLIYQCILDLTGENGKYNYSKAAHLYPPLSYSPCSAKNYKIASALTSEGQQEVAALIGPENFRKLMEVYGGAYLYIPKTDRLERMERNERIRAEFDGYNFRELARKYDLTEITIRSIVSDKVRELRARPMDGQLSLL